MIWLSIRSSLPSRAESFLSGSCRLMARRSILSVSFVRSDAVDVDEVCSTSLNATTVCLNAPGDIRRRLPASPPADGEPFAALFQDFRELIVPGMTHWNHPGWFAYFPGNNSPPSILGEMLTATMGAQCMSWVTSPAATELEQVAMDWLRQMLGLPETFVGVIQDTASTATLVALLSARERATGGASGRSGMDAGARAHRVRLRRCALLDGQGREAGGLRTRSPAARSRAMPRSRWTPPRWSARSSRTWPRGSSRPAWWRPSARPHRPRWIRFPPSPRSAGGAGSGSTWTPPTRGAAAIVPELRGYFAGMEAADSIVFNPHKWLLTNFDCTAYYVRDREALLANVQRSRRNTSAPRTTPRS